jgi:hypothetical protein
MRRELPPSIWPILLFFLVGAAGALIWDLRRPPSSPRPAAPEVPSRLPDGSQPPPARRPARNSSPARHDERRRRDDSRFRRVGIPEETEPGAAGGPRLKPEQAEAILRDVIESREYYGLSPDCLSTRPTGYQSGSYGFEIVTGDCDSIAAGSLIGHWRVDGKSGRASYRNPAGVYEPAPYGR